MKHRGHLVSVSAAPAGSSADLALAGQVVQLGNSGAMALTCLSFAVAIFFPSNYIFLKL